MKFPHGLHNSLNPRPELLAGGMMTSLSVLVITSNLLTLRRPGFYESVYWPLSQLCSMWSNIKGCNLVRWEATFPLIRWSTRLTFSQSWVFRTVGTFLGSEHRYLLFWLFVFWSWLIFFSPEKKMIWFGLAGFLSARRFYHRRRSWVLCRHGFENTKFYIT